MTILMQESETNSLLCNGGETLRRCPHTYPMEMGYGEPIPVSIAGRAAGTPTHVSHACIRRLPAVSLRDRVKVGRGNFYAHVERAGYKGLPVPCLKLNIIGWARDGRL